MDALRPYILEILSITIVVSPIAAAWCLVVAAKGIKEDFKK